MGNAVGTTIKSVQSATKGMVNQVPVMSCFVYPGAVGAVLWFILLLFLGVKVTGTSTWMKKQVCDANGCRDEYASRRWNILLYLFGTAIAFLVVGGIYYRVCWSVYNPTATAGLYLADQMFD